MLAEPPPRSVKFSVTIVSAMVLSVLVALILTPALCASLLKPKKEGHSQLRSPFGWFNKGFDWTSKRYTGGVGRRIGGSAWSMPAFVIVAGMMVFFFAKLPTHFLNRHGCYSGQS